MFRKTEEEKAADEARKQAEEEFGSPVGKATTARQQGQQLFQLLLRLAELNGRSSSLGSSENQLSRADAVFAETGATSSSRVLSTGQGTVTRGTIYGLYIFRAT